jgi:hypothetical protein
MTVTDLVPLVWDWRIKNENAACWRAGEEFEPPALAYELKIRRVRGI